MTTPNYKQTYKKLETITPSTHDHNIVVKVLSKDVIVDKIAKDGKKVRQEQVLVGDETGCVYINAHDDHCEKLIVGKVVALHKTKAKLSDKHMRLGLDKWSSIKDTTVAIPGEILKDVNFSERVYERVVQGS